jgi:hypothetical protein
MTRTRRAIWPGVAFLLWRAPRTRQELIELTGATYAGCDKTIKLLENEGMVVRDGTRGSRGAKVWRWAA